MKDLKNHFHEMILRDCNNKIKKLNEIQEYLTQYSMAITFLIPEKYKETIINELDTLIETHNTPIIYKIEPTTEGNFILNLFNYGVMQRERLLDEMEK